MFIAGQLEHLLNFIDFAYFIVKVKPIFIMLLNLVTFTRNGLRLMQV